MHQEYLFMVMPDSELQRDITEKLVERVVHAFYRRIRADATLGPIFDARIGHSWDAHLTTMVNFWSSVTLMSGRYQGKPHVAHQGLDLTPAHFERWLRLFEATVSDLCVGQAKAIFVDRARRIADSLQIGLNIGPNALQLPFKEDISPSNNP